MSPEPEPHPRCRASWSHLPLCLGEIVTTSGGGTFHSLPVPMHWDNFISQLFYQPIHKGINCVSLRVNCPALVDCLNGVGGEGADGVYQVEIRSRRAGANPA